METRDNWRKGGGDAQTTVVGRWGRLVLGFDNQQRSKSRRKKEMMAPNKKGNEAVLNPRPIPH